MVKFYSCFSCKIFLPLAILLGAFGFSAPAKDVGDSIKRGKLTDTRKDKPAYLNRGVNINFTPFRPGDVKPAGIQPTKPAYTPAQDRVIDTKLLSNIKIYPNPVDDQLNLSYHLSKGANVTVKLMDLLGNEVSVLMSQKIQPGEQVNTYTLSAKLNSGIYFLHIIAGNELTVKRVSVL